MHGNHGLCANTSTRCAWKRNTKFKSDDTQTLWSIFIFCGASFCRLIYDCLLLLLQNKKGWHRHLYFLNRSLLKCFASDHNDRNVNVYHHRRIVLLQRCHSLDFCHYCWKWKMCQSNILFSQSTSFTQPLSISFASSIVRSQFCVRFFRSLSHSISM